MLITAKTDIPDVARSVQKLLDLLSTKTLFLFIFEDVREIDLYTKTIKC